MLLNPKFQINPENLPSRFPAAEIKKREDDIRLLTEQLKQAENSLQIKNSELRRKEEIIEKLKRDILIMQQEFSNEKLNWVNERSRIQDNIKGFRTDMAVNRSRPTTGKNPELESLLNEKDKQIENYKNLLKNADINKHNYERRLKELRNELEKVAYDLNIERSKQNEEKFRKEVDHHKKMLKVKEDEVNRLKNAIQNLKKDFLGNSG